MSKVVEMKTIMAGPKGIVRANQKCKVDEETAKELISGGFAALAKPAQRGGKKVETAAEESVIEIR